MKIAALLIFSSSQIVTWQNNLTNAIGNDRVVGGIDMIGGTLAGEMLHLISKGGLLLSFGSISNKPIQLT